jgi:hypothetical protein
MQEDCSVCPTSAVVVGVVVAGGCDVIDADVLVCCTPVFIGVVQAADRTFLDGAAWSAVGVLARRFALVLGRSVGSEIPAARRGNRLIGWSRTAKAARTRAAEAAAAGTRTAETAAWPARPGTAEAARPWSGRSLFAWTGLADGEGTPLERLLVESSDRFLGDGTIGVIDKSEAARPAGLPIGGKHYLGGISDTRQVIAQLCLCCRVRQVANEQTN